MGASSSTAEPRSRGSGGRTRRARWSGRPCGSCWLTPGGSGSHLKDFYPNLSARVRDLIEFLAEVGLPEPRREVPIRVTYQDACHLVHAQRIRKPPRQLLRAVPGLEFVEMTHPDICCG